MKHQGKSNAKRSGLIYLILFLIFFIPIALAWIMFTKKDTLGEKTLNHGTLITPPFSIAKLNLYNSAGHLLDNRVITPTAKTVATTNGKWLFLLVVSKQCNTICQRGLYNMRQIRVATGAQRNRIERAVLTFQGSGKHPTLRKLLSTKYAGTLQLSANKEQFLQVFGKHVKHIYALENGTLYIVDPLGNVMMNYQSNANPSNIFKDMERLLKVSQIG